MSEENKIELTLETVEEVTAPDPSELVLSEEKEIKTTSASYEDQLSEEEKKQVEEFASKINLDNTSLVLQYGASAQKKISSFSEKALENVKTKDLGEIGNMLSTVVTELKNFDVDEKDSGLFGIFKKTANKANIIKAKYAKAETNITDITKVLENHQIQLLKDIEVLDNMYDLNKTYFKELSMYILAGKKKLDEAKNKDLPELLAKAQASNLPEDSQKVSDMENLINRFEKKIHDLELTRMISLQMAPQIRMVQNNDAIMEEKIRSTIVNTIPLWKSQMVIALGMLHSTDAAKAQKEVADLSNELLRKNADALKMSSIETARESERGIIDLETIRYTNQALISTLTEVRNIQKEGSERRAQAQAELIKLEHELKERLLEISSRTEEQRKLES